MSRERWVFTVVRVRVSVMNCHAWLLYFSKFTVSDRMRSMLVANVSLLL